MARSENRAIVYTAFSDAFRAKVHKALGEDRDTIYRQIETGECIPSAFLINGEPVGFAVTKVHRGNLVVAAYEGSNLYDFTESLYALCWQAGIKEIRWFSKRGPAMERMLSDFCPDRLTYVLRIKVYGRR